MEQTRVRASLDGTWRLALDPEDRGRRERWFEADNAPVDALEVTVPAVWDLWAPDYDGVGWYFRSFTLDSAFVARHVTVEFEAADYYAEVWLNGRRIGEHEGGYTPFSLPAEGAAVAGENYLAVRIIDPHGAKGYGEYHPAEIPSSKEGGYYSFAGVWGSVAVESRDQLHFTDLFVKPDLRHKRLTVEAETTGSGEVSLRIAGTEYSTAGAPGTLRLEFPEFEPWSPDSPTLYTLECSLLFEGRVTDTQSVRFGMREFTVKDNRFFLNNRPILVRGVLHQPDYARSIAAPESPELARRELTLAKQAGFNLVRLHIKTAPRITLELADELGLMLYEEPPIGWIRKSPRMKERCEREVREMILRDRNHPSVVAWGMLNESGNADYVVEGGAQTVKDDLCRLARQLDPTRLIIDDSGGTNTTREHARFMRPYHDEFEPYDDLHIYQRAPVDYEIEQYYRHSGDPARLFFLSEFGFGGMEDLPDVIAQYGSGKDLLKDARFLQAMLDAGMRGFQERGLDRLFGDFSGFARAAQVLQCDAVRYQVDALLANPKHGGYCYTQLCDAGHEFCAGVLDRWRRPKPVFDTFRQVQAPLRPLIHVARTNLVPRQEVPVTVTLINEERVEDRVDLSLQVVGPTNQVLWKKKRSIKIARGNREIWTGTVAASGSTGAHRFVVRLLKGPKVIAENTIEFFVLPQPAQSEIPVHVVDPYNEWTPAIADIAVPAKLKAPLHIVPPLANTVRAYPESDLLQVLSEVREGAVALVFGPPDDWNDLADRVEPSLRATSKDATGAFLGVYHYAKLHPVFEGLPARGLMGQPYRNVVAPKTFVEESDEDICGAFDTTPIAAGNYMMDRTDWWGSDILVRRFGSGRIVFTHMRLLENAQQDPAAGHLLVNMLRHFVRRSVPGDVTEVVALEPPDWLRREREDARLWMVIGMFPNWGDDDGHRAAYPPEQAIDLKAVYPGWYKSIEWKRWYSRRDQGHHVNLQEAFTPVYEYYPRFDNGTGYAYAEFYSDARYDVRFRLRVQDATKVWLNQRMIFEHDRHRPHKDLGDFSVPAMLKQGRNNILVKVSKIPGEFQFALDIEPAGNAPLNLKWWK